MFRRNSRDGQFRCPTAYPRACGGTSPTSPSPVHRRGLSPRLRGNHLRIVESVPQAGSIPVDPDSVTKSFRRAASRAGLEGFRFHDLRHTHASLLMSQNVHPKVVSERLGHSDVVITLNLYSHVLPNVQEEAAERFGEAWRERSPDGGTSG